ncbi:MAG: agmatine deiminase family protein [Gordonia sp. (in: high G+C Gram-positive bacteria)]
MTWMMPAEGVAQERVWMAYPSSGYSLGETGAEQDSARSTWAAVAHAIAEYEPVTMLVDPAEVRAAKRYLSSAIEIVATPLDDAWARDIGPTFVLDEQGRLGAVDWVFNGWGAAPWATWEKDRHVARLIAELSGAELISSSMINEGGGIQVDGEGTVLVTETVQLGEGRNSDWTHAQVEAELARTIGASTAIWLPFGLTRDNADFGTRGHVDIVAAFPSPGVLLFHSQQDPAHPDFEVSKTLRDVLSGHPFEIIDVPAPQVLTDDDGFVDYSYINHLVINGAVIACTYDDPNDTVAQGILADAYPGREVIGIDARPIFARGGGVHCITCQQPS